MWPPSPVPPRPEGREAASALPQKHVKPRKLPHTKSLPPQTDAKPTVLRTLSPNLRNRCVGRFALESAEQVR